MSSAACPAGNVYSPYDWFRMGNQDIQKKFTGRKKKICELKFFEGNNG
jgi:hypothetical protein